MAIAPYGSWKSPITADVLVASNIGLSQPIAHDDSVYWKEGRPQEAGRNAIVRRRPDGTTEDVIAVPFNARTRVHEYGGADYLVEGETMYFANFADQRVYVVRPGAGPEPLTHADGHRYGDFVLDHARNRLICVRELEREDMEPENDIGAIHLTSGDEVSLAAGHDFFDHARLSPDGTKLAWIAWDHPNMPWDATMLFVADFAADGTLRNVRQIAGGADESVLQPEWSPDGRLHFISDRSGYWNLYRFDNLDSAPVALCSQAYDFAQPLWQIGSSSYDFDGDRILVTYARDGLWRLAVLDVSGTLTDIDVPITSAGSVRTHGGYAYLLAGFATQPAALVRIELRSGAMEVLKRTSTLELDEGYVSVAEPVEFPTAGGLTAHAFFYPPRNKDFEAPAGDQPPLLVMSHGGPTAATAASFSPRIQYWTSRGVAVLDVNYGGSTGYGREYRERLRGSWGIVDVEDCVNGAMHMAAQGRVDRDKLAITGGSAGGFTTLAALAFHDVFKAGASHYGVSDLEALATDTHKFEARYLDSLIGPYPEARDTYIERSPIHHTDRLSTPVAFFQGLEDRIVPPNQAESMVEALRMKGVPVAYFPFEGEQHGFRRAENIKRSLEAELLFYGRIFGFEPADDIEPFEIENL